MSYAERLNSFNDNLTDGINRAKEIAGQAAQLKAANRDPKKSKKLGYAEGKDPKVGTGKKPKGSGRRLYTDEDPSDTVKVKFSTRQNIVDTLNKSSFKSKSHARQSQVINLIHQRVRAALNRADRKSVV